MVDGVTQRITPRRRCGCGSALVLIAVMVYLLRYVWRVLLFGASYQLAVELRAILPATEPPASGVLLPSRTGILSPAPPMTWTGGVCRWRRSINPGGFLVRWACALIVMSTQISWQLTLLALLADAADGPGESNVTAMLRYERFSRVAQAAFPASTIVTQESLTQHPHD